MVCSAPITPAATRTGELLSRRQTWTRKFPAIFWMMALSWSAVLSNCGRFLWLHTEPCSLCPVGLGRNWYYLLQPQKTLSQTMVRWSEMPLSTTLPSLSTLPIPYPSYVDLLSPPPHANANGSGERLCQLNCMVNTNRQNETIATEVAILVSLMLNQGPS